MEITLQSLFEQDQSDTVTFRGAESFLASQARRALAEQLLEAGAAHSAEDYFHGAMLLQHGDRPEHHLRARELALKATEMGHPRARYMVAAATDRWLMRQGKPQKYGTNTYPSEDGSGWRVWDYDPATTDEDRAEWDVPPIAELLRRVKTLGDGRTLEEIAASGFVTVEFQGVRIELFDLRPEKIRGRPPEYEIVRPGDSLPRWLPGGLTSNRFGELFCARDESGEPALTWHFCGWRPVGESPSVQELSRAIGPDPIWLNEEGRVWSRVSRQTEPEFCWLLGGTVPREDILRVMESLIPFWPGTKQEDWV
jgi:hypothetical protein